MAENQVVFEKRGSVGIITLNRPDHKNAVTVEMAQDLSAIRSGIRWDSDIHVFLITAAGSDFCIGTDPAAVNALENKEDRLRYLAMASTIASLTQPTIAVIQGSASGQGLEIALACDMRIGAEGASYAMCQADAGTLPFDGGTQRLPRLVGRAKAVEMMLTGISLTAVSAMDLGLINQVFPEETLMLKATELAHDLAAKGPVALRYAKEAVMKGLDLTLDQGLRLEADLYCLLHTTHDRKEGIAAFREKRAPEFKGK